MPAVADELANCEACAHQQTGYMNSACHGKHAFYVGTEHSRVFYLTGDTPACHTQEDQVTLVLNLICKVAYPDTNCVNTATFGSGAKYCRPLSSPGDAGTYTLLYVNCGTF